jgi:hypothetical protein
MSDDAAIRTGQQTLWRRLHRVLWQPPRPHGEQPCEPVVGPLELFYGLAGGPIGCVQNPPLVDLSEAVVTRNRFCNVARLSQTYAAPPVSCGALTTMN